MNFSQLKKIFQDKGCDSLYIKELAPNDNSKNQVYLAGSFDLLNVFPFGEVKFVDAGDWKRDRFKASLDFYWLSDSGIGCKAPYAQLILYPKYPEIRFSGFLKKCSEAPSLLMSSRDGGRVLFFGFNNYGELFGYVTSVDSILAIEYRQHNTHREDGVFRVVDLGIDGKPIIDQNRNLLLDKLREIHGKGWIDSKRLNSNNEIVSCNSPNCGGYTLEAELGIIPNGISEPDYLGWEVKQFGVAKWNLLNSKPITLMTPEPTGGFYKEESVIAFVKRYGYPDQNGKPDRMNFGGVHKASEKHKRTKLTFRVLGYNPDSQKIEKVSGCLALVDEYGDFAATWDFPSLMKHWNKKHSKAVYIPSLKKATPRQYFYSEKVLLAQKTNFIRFLDAIATKNIYYDPGIKVENISTARPLTKRRSQFRIKSGSLTSLYEQHEWVNLDFP